jgi:MraZ protein
LAFRGTFDYTLDAKNRLTVPARFRKALQGDVVLAKSFERCVQIWPAEDYEAYTQTVVAGRNPASPDARKLKRFFSSGSTDTELDSAGRVMLPPFLLEHAGLKKDVVVTGAGECLEIWDRTAWSSYEEDLDATVPDIAASLDHTP